MKKITLWLFALFTCWQINAQVNVVENFNSGTTLPAGWTEAGGKTIAAAESCQGNSIRDNLYSFSTTGNLVSPNQVAASNGTDLTFSFDYKVENWNATTAAAPGWGNFTVDYSTDNGTTWYTFFTVNDGNHVTANTCANFTNVIPAASLPAGSDVRFRFNMTWTAGDWDLYLDNISATQVSSTPPTCTTVSSPANGAVNITSGVISWSVPSGIPTGYFLTVGTTSGGNDVLNSFDVGNVTSYNLGVLAAGTTYYTTIVPYNLNGNATGCTETSFTSCGAMMAPWTYDVEAAAATTNSTIADCWSSIPTVTNAAYRWDVDDAGSTPSFGTGPSGAFSGNKYFYTEASSGGTGAIAELYTPMVNISALTEPTLQFYYHMFGVNMGELHVDVFNGTSWVNDVDVIIGQQQAAETDPWLERVVDLSSYSGTIQVRFRAIRGIGFEGDMSLDDISFDEAPACLPVTGLAVSNITSSSVQLDWNDMSGVGQFDFEYAIQVQGTGTPTGAGVPLADITVIETNDITATPLAPNSPYEVYVRADCGGGLFSSWVGPVNFTTECATYAAPLLETFDTYLPACWQAADNGDLVAGPAAFGTAGWFADGFGNVGFTGAITYNIWLAAANDWVISPTINIPATGYELKFDAAATQYGGTNAPTTPWEADDFVEVLVSTSGYTNWTVLYTYNNTNVPAPTGTTNIIDLDAYAGQDVRFAYRAVEGTADGGADLQFFVDNFEVRLTPSLPPSCASNIVATPNATCGNFANSITWDATVGADGYYLTIGTSTGASDILNNSDLGNVLSYSFTGTIGTTYYYTLLPYNGVGPATGCTEMSFVTNSNGCYCTSVPTSLDGNGITNVQIVATNFPNAAVSYTDNSATPVDMSQGISNNVQITFATGYTYDTNIWIDFNNDFDFDDAGELVQTGIASTAANPTTLNASFVMPGTAPLGAHRMRIGTSDTGQVPPNACYSGAWGVTIDFTVNIIAASCSPVTVASSTVTPDCANAQFSVAIDVTALGSGTPAISDGTTSWPVAAIGVINVGPFADGTSVTLTALHGSDSTCDLPLGSFTYTCPPANDNCATAQVLTPGGVFTDNPVVGSNVGATDATETAPSCAFYQGEEVWYSVTVPASGNITIECDTNTGTAITDTGLAVYSGSCGSLTQIGCDDDGGNGAFSIVSLTGRTPGEILYVSVWEYGGGTYGTFQVSAYDASLSSGSFDNNSFVAYPNPVKDIFNVSYSSEISSVRVMNLLGQEVITREVNATSTQIDMSQLSSGAYIVNVTVGDTIKTIKVVKQ